MNRTKLSLLASAFALGAALSTPTLADPTPECNNGTGILTTECGTNSSTGTFDGATAVGANADVDGNASTAIGASADTFEDRTTAVGTQARATIEGATAIGNGASAISTLYSMFSLIGFETAPGTLGGTAVGVLAQTYGTDSVALGAFATVGDPSLAGSAPFLDGSTAIGASSGVRSNQGTALGAHTEVTGEGAIAVGYGSSSSGTDAIALGTGATATHTNSVAIGAGTTTTADNQVNVGGRTISGVAAGAISATSTDAINGSQLFTLNQSITNTSTQITALNTTVGTHTTQIAALQAMDTALDTRIDALEALSLDFTGDLDRIDERASAGTATAIAMSGGAFLPDKTFNLTGNVGAYRGAVAGALQVGALVSENMAVNAGVAYGFNKGGKTGIRAGFTIGW